VNLNVKVFKIGPYLLPVAAQRVIGDLIPHRDFDDTEIEYDFATAVLQIRLFFTSEHVHLPSLRIKDLSSDIYRPTKPMGTMGRGPVPVDIEKAPMHQACLGDSQPVAKVGETLGPLGLVRAERVSEPLYLRRHVRTDVHIVAVLPMALAVLGAFT
jgi:hypothetical protein